jgi:peptidoglycan/LPS O-acetylase OafA/YrhL
VTKIRNDIQALRGVAVLVVLLFHTNSEIFSLGYLGVDIFFVISGFVITPQISKIFRASNRSLDTAEVKIFYKRRYYRLMPALASSLMFSGFVLYFLISPDYHARVARQGIASLFFLGNFGALIYSGNYFSPEPNPLIHMWSLAVEMQIYLFLPFLLMILHKAKIPWKISFLGLMAVSLMFFFNPIISESILSILGFEDKLQASFYSPIDRFWQFAVGGILSWFSVRKSFVKNCVIFLIIIFIIVCELMRIQLTDNNRFWSILVTLLTALAISSKFLDKKGLKFFKYLGDRSYSVYLFHLPILSILQYSPVFKMDNDIEILLRSTFGVLISIILGSLNYIFIEARFRSHSSQKKLPFSKNLLNLIYIFLPLSFFLGADKLSSQATSEFYKEYGIEAAAWDLDQKCSRMSNAGGPCEYDADGALKSVVLIGDSHAAQYSQVLVDSAKENGWTSIVWTHSGCPFQLKPDTNQQVTLECINQNLIKKKWIVQNLPEVIIVSYNLGDRHNVSLLLEALLEIKPFAGRVVLIENNPIFPDKGKFGERLPLIVKPYTPPKFFAINEMNNSGEGISNALAILASNNGIETINVDYLFCKFDKCHRWLSGQWLYGDDNHLSLAGAKLIKPLLVEILD